MAYNENFVKIFIESLPKTNETAFDIGACMGTYTRLLAQKFDQVFAFEACPATNANYLVPSVKNYPNVRVINTAISNKTGRTRLFTTSFTDGAGKGGNSISNRIVNTGKWGHSQSHYTEIDSVTIDKFVQFRKISNLGFIKMDIEGAENFAWNGAIETLKTNKLNIILEVHMEVDYQELHQFFRDLDYKIFDDMMRKAKNFFPDSHYLITNRI
jgi:FkbM family methyltransferase